MPRRRVRIVSCLLFALLLLKLTLLAAEPPHADQVQVSTPALRTIEPPPQSATVQMLEERADALRAEKLYLDALDYYRAALVKDPHNAPLYNKKGIVELLMQRWPDARKSFEELRRQQSRCGVDRGTAHLRQATANLRIDGVRHQRAAASHRIDRAREKCSAECNAAV